MSFMDETNTEVNLSLKKDQFTAESVFIKEELDDFDNSTPVTKVNFFLKKNPCTTESIFVKEELDAFDNWKTAHEIDGYLVQKITIKSEEESYASRTIADEVDGDLEQKATIKSKEENFINSQYLISNEEGDIKSEDDVEQLDNGITPNEVYQDLDQKTTVIKRHDLIKSEEEDLKNSQYLISHEEVDIKSEDVVEPSIHSAQPNITVDLYELKLKLKLKMLSFPKKNLADKVGIPSIWPHQGGPKPKTRRKIYKCLKCPYQTKYKKNIIQHTVVDKKPDEIVCETPSKPSLDQHLLVHYLENIPWLHCPEPKCRYKTRKERNLKRHFPVHNNVKLFQCTLCPYQAKRRVHLRQHYLKHASPDKWHACPQCPFETNRKGSLKKHLLTHANPDQLKWYICEQCPYKTYRKYNFKEHALSQHMDQAPNGCTKRAFHVTPCENPASGNT